MPKEYVLVKSFSGSLNMGDEAMLASNLNIFRERLGKKYNFVVLSINPELTSAIHSVESRSTFIGLLGRWTKIGGRLKILWLAFRLLWNAKRIRNGQTPKLLNSKELNFLYTFANCEAFFLVGCGLKDIYSFWGIFSTNIMILLAVILEKAVFLGAQTFALSKPWTRWFTKFVLRRATLITVRETKSKRILNKMGIKNVKLSCDDAFDIEPISKKQAITLLLKEGVDFHKIKEKSRKLVAINVRPLWKIRGAETKLKEAFAEVVKFLTDEGHFVIFVPISYAGATYTDDVEGAKEIVKYADTEKRNFKVLNKFLYNWKEIKGILALADLAIGASYHFCVFSVSNGTPTLGLYQDKYYEVKLAGFFEFLDLKNFAIDVLHENLSEVINKTFEALETNTLKQTFEASVVYLRAKFEPCYAAKKFVKFL